MKIVVLAGGISTERNVSFSSGTMICGALSKGGHNAVLIDLFLGLENYSGTAADIFDRHPALPGKDIGAVAPDLEAVKASRLDKSSSVFGPGVLEVCKLADMVFLGLHGACGEDGRVQAAFDLMGIPYTGSGYLGSAIAMDKDFTKRLARSAGVLTPDWAFVTVTAENLFALAGDTALPCVVKVPDGGSSIGVTLCHTKEELTAALGDAMGTRVLVEQFITGREFSCGVLDSVGLPPIEIIPKVGFYDYVNKYQTGATVEVCPADITAEADEKMRTASVQVHSLLGLSAYSRSDFIMDASGAVYFLEVNTLPGMTPNSLLPQEAAAVGIDYGTLCQKIVTIAQKERG